MAVIATRNAGAPQGSYDPEAQSLPSFVAAVPKFHDAVLSALTSGDERGGGVGHLDNSVDRTVRVHKHEDREVG